MPSSTELEPRQAALTTPLPAAPLGADLGDLSSTVLETCSALGLSLREGDVVAAERLFGFLLDQLADRRLVVSDVFAPMVARHLRRLSDVRHRQLFVSTCADLLSRLRRPVSEHGDAGALLYSACDGIATLDAQMLAVLLDDAHVPATVMLDLDEEPSLRRALASRWSVVAVTIDDASQLKRCEPLVRAFRKTDTSVVLVGDMFRDVPTLATKVGASASVAHLGEATDVLLQMRGPLTPAETEVLRLAADGYTNVRIAHELGISVSAVKARLEAGYTKLRAADRAHAVAIALRHRWIR